MNKFTAKIVSRLRKEIIESRKVCGSQGPALRKNEDITKLNDLELILKRKRRDVLDAYKFVDQGRWHNFKIKLYKRILKLLEQKPVKNKERLTDVHFEHELRYLVKDTPETVIKTRADRLKTNCWVEDERIQKN